jgi:flagellar basal-body rod modification protein FlgD
MNAMDTSSASSRVAQSLASRSAASAPTAKTAAPAASATSSTSDNGVITSNDFLTLLVTEMKNQDPTAPTDPNAYIQQLVGVNSLQQLISINQDLTPSTTTSSGTSGTT